MNLYLNISQSLMLNEIQIFAITHSSFTVGASPGIYSKAKHGRDLEKGILCTLFRLG